MAYDVFEQFGCPISTYGMKDDVLEMCGGDMPHFARQYASMKARLRALVRSAACHYSSCDMFDAAQRARVGELLASTARSANRGRKD